MINLSEKIENGWVIHIDNIKQAVKELRAKVCKCSAYNCPCSNCLMINELFGDRLI